jgi:hypothetical protein
MLQNINITMTVVTDKTHILFRSPAPLLSLAQHGREPQPQSLLIPPWIGVNSKQYGRSHVFAAPETLTFD